jgi:hypothetical protein
METFSGCTTSRLWVPYQQGWALEKRLWKDETFADIKYTLEMVKQVWRTFPPLQAPLQPQQTVQYIQTVKVHDRY